ncbi:MAG: hypothetical protein O3C40_05165, partial [Planctomycetota bacterium]|nr:hypothetical protein [Planctomycetota bacterium]
PPLLDYTRIPAQRWRFQTPFTGDLMSNDTGAGSMIVVSLPTHGKLFGGSGELAVGDTFSTWSYTPTNDNADEGWHGTDTWTYKVRQPCMDGSTQDSNSATVTVNVPEVNMVIYHGQGGAAVDKTKERVTNQLDANGNPVLDANGNKVKVGEGAFTVANLNDTDNDGHADYTTDDHAANGGHAAANGRNEVDLIKVVLKKPSFYPAGAMMRFDVTFGNGAHGSAKIWKDEYRDQLEDPSPSLTFGESETERIYWVELISPSVEIGDYHFSYGYMQGGLTDYASATAVWASVTAVEHNNRTGAAILADPKWADVSGVVRTALESQVDAGLLPVARALGILNVIYQRWTVTPPRIHQYSDIVKVDVGRRLESIRWSIDDNGNVVVNPITGVVVGFEEIDFEGGDEFANDDASELDETGPDLSAHDHIFSLDTPGTDSAAPAILQFWVKEVNFEEFVRIGIGANDPHDNGVSGSRASEKFKWHASFYLQEINGFWYRRPLLTGPNNTALINPNENVFNEIGPEHIVFRTAWDNPMPPGDVPPPP